MPKGKKSTRQKLEEHFGKPISTILKQFEGVKTSKEAAKKVASITENKITATPLTMERMASTLSLNPKHHPWAVPKPKGRRGKMSIRERLETNTKKSIWEILKPFKGRKREEAAKALSVNVLSLRRMVEQALEDEEEEAKAFEAWTTKRKRGRRSEKDENTDSQEEFIPVVYECRKCGQTVNSGENSKLCRSPHWLTISRAKRCHKCQKWGCFNIIIKHPTEGTVYFVSELPPPQSDQTYEYYQTDSTFTKRIKK